MNDLTLLVLPVIAAAAFYVKGLTGFGPALVFIPIGALLFPPQAVVVASTTLDLVAGVLMWRAAFWRVKPAFFIGIALAAALGTVCGVFLFARISADTYRALLGLSTCALGLWFALIRPGIRPAGLSQALPDTCDRQDVGFSMLAGISGGLFGVSGPPVIFHFGRRFHKSAFREILIVFFLFAAIVRTCAFSVAGMVTATSMLYAACSLPGVALGLYLGNRTFLQLDEKRFSQIVGMALVGIGVLIVV